MGIVIIQEHTTKKPITMIGEQAGVCWDSDIRDSEKNYKRGLNCLKRGHGRTWEFPDVYMIINGFSARVIRELYTHIGGLPTRLQASTRYVNYENFDYIIPSSILKDKFTRIVYQKEMANIRKALQKLEACDVPKEDLAMLLPLGMTTKITCKYNLRTLIDMSHQRMCSRAYWEYRELFGSICEALKEYSEEWAYLVDNYFQPKCDLYGYCTESKSCGRKPKIEELRGNNDKKGISRNE